MLRLIGMLVLLGGAFSLGYYVGQRPVGDLRAAVAQLSRNVFDTTLGMERNLRQRHALIEAKSRLVQAKAEFLEKNFGNAAKALAETADNLHSAADSGPDLQRAKLKTLAKRAQDVQLEMAQGKRTVRGRLDEMQAELDTLL